MTKATSISDILAVQSQLDTLQSQIEQLQGQLQVLDSQTTYGTLVVSVSEPGHRSTPPPAPRSGIGAAWHGAVSGFTAAFDGLVRGSGRRSSSSSAWPRWRSWGVSAGARCAGGPCDRRLHGHAVVPVPRAQP